MSLALAMTRSKTAVFFLTVTQYDGSVQILTGLTLYFHALVDGVHVNKDSGSNGIVITDALGGLATLTIDPVDTEDVGDGVSVGSCELTLVDPADGARYELNSGTLKVTANVGTP